MSIFTAQSLSMKLILQNSQIWSSDRKITSLLVKRTVSNMYLFIEFVQLQLASVSNYVSYQTSTGIRNVVNLAQEIIKRFVTLKQFKILSGQWVPSQLTNYSLKLHIQRYKRSYWSVRPNPWARISHKSSIWVSTEGLCIVRFYCNKRFHNLLSWSNTVGTYYCYTCNMQNVLQIFTFKSVDV